MATDFEPQTELMRDSSLCHRQKFTDIADDSAADARCLYLRACLCLQIAGQHVDLSIYHMIAPDMCSTF